MTNRQLEHHDHSPGGRKFPLSILAHDLDDAVNIGSLFRLCDALGVEQLYLTGTTPAPPRRRISKTSRSTEKHVAYRHADSPIEVINTLKTDGYTIISLELTTDSCALAQMDFRRFEKICLLPGTEKNGVDQMLLDISDYTVHIPMQGHNSSMNVVTATAIAVYEITRQWQTDR
ncbi:MAG: TrmH family RNA methyltransferase [Gammaproteobacteria bacterium]|nr:TrmH family RNA methyltransferase [Gammaproteobacteria bacterium]MDH5651127.1 TrmH family RNA methyltransferase [Gammaproteobacteria bacterium]